MSDTTSVSGLKVLITSQTTVAGLEVEVAAEITRGGDQRGQVGSVSNPSGTLDPRKDNLLLTGQLVLPTPLNLTDLIKKLVHERFDIPGFPHGALPEIEIDDLTVAVHSKKKSMTVCLTAYVGKETDDPKPNLQFLVAYVEASSHTLDQPATQTATSTRVILGAYTSPIQLPDLGADEPNILKGLLDQLSITELGVAYSNQDQKDFTFAPTTIHNMWKAPTQTNPAHTISLEQGFAFLATLHTPNSIHPISLHLGRPSSSSHPTAATAGAALSHGKWFNINKSLGPVHIARIGLQYTDGAVRALLDASIMVSALTLGLNGFYLGFKVADLKADIKTILAGLEIGLAGASSQFQKIPHRYQWGIAQNHRPAR